MERFVKIKFQNKNGKWLSAIEPKEYQRRFMRQLKKMHETPFDYQHREIFL